MKFTKYGHSCILLDDGQTQILFDPGKYSKVPELKLEALFISHAHADHLNTENIFAITRHNPSVRIYSNKEVNFELAKHHIDGEVFEQGETVTVNGFSITGIGNDHATIHPDLPIAQNTGFVINGNILHPGDFLTIPKQAMEILFLPIFAPWSKVQETLDYVTAMKPKVIVPIHDGPLNDPGAFYWATKLWCEKYGIKFLEAEPGKEYEI